MIITKGLGSNRLIADGYGYSFYWRPFVQQFVSGASGGMWWRPYADADASTRLARRPRRRRKLEQLRVEDSRQPETPSYDANELAAVVDVAADTREQPVAPAPVIPTPPRRKTSTKQAKVLAPLPTVKRLSTGTKVAIAIGVGAVVVYLLRRREKSKSVGQCTCEAATAARNAKTMGTRVLRAFRKSGITRKGIRRTDSFFMHGQWWIRHQDTGTQWRVYDCRSGVDGFCFEQLDW